jgi:hypothetical protein
MFCYQQNTLYTELIQSMAEAIVAYIGNKGVPYISY